MTFSFRYSLRIIATSALLWTPGITVPGCSGGEDLDDESIPGDDPPGGDGSDSVGDEGGEEEDSTPGGDDTGSTGILVDSDFSVMDFDTGDILGSCTDQPPWGRSSWGIEGATFSPPADNGITRARFALDGEAGHLTGEELDGRWGHVRYIQGDIWSSTNCSDSVNWHVFSPVDLSSTDHEVTLGLERGAVELHTEDDSEALFAVHLWFSSPELPQAGSAVYGKKPLALTFVLHHECNFSGCSQESFANDYAYHYRVVVDDPDAGTHLRTLAIAEHLDAAFDFFGLPGAARENIRLFQAEFGIGLHRAEGSATIDDFQIRPVVAGSP